MAVGAADIVDEVMVMIGTHAEFRKAMVVPDGSVEERHEGHVAERTVDKELTWVAAAAQARWAHIARRARRGRVDRSNLERADDDNADSRTSSSLWPYSLR